MTDDPRDPPPPSSGDDLPEPEDIELDLPDRLEDVGWREPPRPPEIPDILRQPVARPASLTPPPREGLSDTAKAFGIALDFIATTLVGAGLGWLLGRWLGNMPAFVLGGLALGLTAAFVRVVRATQKAERLEAEARKRQASRRP